MLEFWSKQLLLSAKSDPYKPETVLFESATPGSYNVEILGKGKYEVYCIGAGGGGLGFISHMGSGTHRNTVYYRDAGGSGSGFVGIIVLDKGNCSLVVGTGGNRIASKGTAGAGGNSSISNSITAFGGTGGSTGTGNGLGGQNPQITAKIVSTTLNVPGNAGTGGTGTSYSRDDVAAYGGTSVYNGYGAGGGHDSNGANGYIKIVYKGQ